MMLTSGLLLEPDNVSSPDARIELDDILIGLSRQPRFGGHTQGWWSVLHHTMVCFTIGCRMEGWLTETFELILAHILLHDAHEAVVGDLSNPWKDDERRAVEHRIDGVVFRSFNVPAINEQERHAVKWVDNQALGAEAELLGPVGITDQETIPAASENAKRIVAKVRRRWPDESCRQTMIVTMRNVMLFHVVAKFKA